MDYRIVFEDNSEFLVHHGTKGMKWGVWNEETRARRLGKSGVKSSVKEQRKQAAYAKETGKELERSLKTGDWRGENVRLTNDVHERLADARKKLYDSDPLAKEYYSNPELQKKYKEKYADKLAEKYGKNDPDARRRYRQGVLLDDLDQGSMSAFTFESSYDLYVKDKVKDPNAYFAKQHKATNDYRNVVKAEVSKVLGPYGDQYTHRNPNGSSSRKINDEVFYQSLTRAKDEQEKSRKYYDPWKDEKLLKELLNK